MIPMPTKIKCQFKGCSGEIDLMKEMRELLHCYCEGRKPKVVHLSWCIHTVMCQKCKNPVAHINVGPEPWVTLDDDNEEPKKHSIHNPRNGKCIIVSDDRKSLDPHLKKWARMYDEEEEDESK